MDNDELRAVPGAGMGGWWWVGGWMTWVTIFVSKSTSQSVAAPHVHPVGSHTDLDYR
jgi:hypothetical protein